LLIGHGVDPGSDFLKPDSGAGVPDPRFSQPGGRLAIPYSGPILIIVRQRTFVCQHLAEVAVLNPRAAQLAPIAVHRAFAAKRFARIVGHRSRAS
jgi:hypothetical protein